MNVRLRSLLCLSVSRGHRRCTESSTRTTHSPRLHHQLIPVVLLQSFCIRVRLRSRPWVNVHHSGPVFFGVGEKEKSPSAYSCRVTALYLSTCTYDEDLLGSFRLVQTAGNQTGRECRPCHSYDAYEEDDGPMCYFGSLL